jgi:REP-associated tyrosine transposase
LLSNARRRHPPGYGRLMARALRHQAAGAIYHIMSRGVRKLPVFTSDDDRVIFLHILAETVRQFGWQCRAYCLMRNHYHAVVVTPKPNVGVGMKRLNGLYAQNFNRRHGLRGHVFEDRYRSVDVVSETQFVTVLQYVVLNPVQSGLCSGPDQWPWSSYRATVGTAPAPRFLDVSGVLSWFDADTDRARQLYRSSVYSRLEERHAAALGADAVR